MNTTKRNVHSGYFCAFRPVHREGRIDFANPKGSILMAVGKFVTRIKEPGGFNVIINMGDLA